jgi:phosphomannomutase/phosphoglucomutase
MKINPFMFRGYDLRGEVDKDLNQEIVLHLGKVFGTFLKRRGIKKAVVGRDSRATSPEYSRAIIQGLNWAGIDTIDIGMELIGTFYWAQYYLACRGGVYISASHNPAQYNGFKFANDFSETLVSEDMQELRQMTKQDDIEPGELPGKNESQEVRQAYFNDLTKRLPVAKKFKVVIDPSCSTAGAIVPDLLKRIGCEAIENNCNLDSSFPVGTPDPTEQAVANRIKERLLKEKADIGFSYDSDGDRLGIVDEKGNVILNDVLTALFAISVLKQHPEATIMYNILCSKVVEETILKYGGKPFIWRVGHSFLKKKNQEVKAAFIGELSGHFFFSADFYNHDDGLYSTLRLLNYLSETNQSLSQAISTLPKYISSPEIKLYCADDKKVALVEKIAPILKKDFPQARVIDDERAGDGARLDFKDSMFVIRYSQNGPYITIKFEAKTETKYNELKKYINKVLHQYEEIDWASKINVNVDALLDGLI